MALTPETLDRLQSIREVEESINNQWLATLTQDQVEHVKDLVNEQGFPLCDIREFVQDFGFTKLTDGTYELWCRLTDQFPESVVEEFVEECGVGCLTDFTDWFYGQHSNVKDFVQEYMESMGIDVPEFVQIDYSATWEVLTNDGWFESGGYYFFPC